MLDQIENAILSRLGTAGFTVFHLDEMPNLREKDIQTPVACLYTESGDFKTVSQRSMKCKVRIVLFLAWQHGVAADIRKRGLYPLLLGVTNSLTYQKMGLQITPIRPVRFARSSDKDMERGGNVAYELEFETSFNIDYVDDEQAVDLLKIGLEYYLQDPADDGEHDAQDIVEV
jgi:hypothetical protein